MRIRIVSSNCTLLELKRSINVLRFNDTFCSNCTLLELKLELSKAYPVYFSSSNCTLLELKHVLRNQVFVQAFCSNCTLLELKLYTRRFVQQCAMEVQIVPCWN